MRSFFHTAVTLFALAAMVFTVGCSDTTTPSSEVEPEDSDVQLQVADRSECGGFEPARKIAQAGSDETCVAWEYDGEGGMTLYHYNAGLNCCTELVATLHKQSDVITIEETETGLYCHCLCLFDIEYELDGMTLPMYTLTIETLYKPEGDAPISFEIDLVNNPTGAVCFERSDYPWE